MLSSLFGFQRVSREDPLANLRSLRAWASKVPRNDPVAAAERVVPLIRAEAARADGTSARLDALVELDRITSPLIDQLRAQYRQVSLSDDVRQRLLLLCETIAQGFSQSYAHYVRAVEGTDSLLGSQAGSSGQHAVFVRMFHHISTLTRLGLFRYEQWIPGRWRALHQAYATARRRSIAQEPFALQASRGYEQSTAEQEYIGILLLHRINSGNLTTPQIDWASEWVRDWVAPMRLVPPALDSDEGGYWVDLGEGEGLTDRRPLRTQGELLFLDMEPFRAQLKALIGRLMSQAGVGRAMGDSDDALALAKRVDRLWQPHAPLLQRRGERRSATNGVTVAAGWTEILPALQARARATPPPGYYYDERGRLRNTNELRDLAGRRFERYAWQITDTSESGFRIRSSSREATRQWPGTLISLQIEDTSGWQLAIVRRLKRIGADLTELGVEVISRNIALVTPRDRDSRDSGYTVDGIDVETTGKTFQALYLPPQIQGRVRAPASLVIPASEFALHRRLAVTVEGQSHSILLASPLERARDWMWVPLRSG